jgi:hypothetical protein
VKKPLLLALFLLLSLATIFWYGSVRSDWLGEPQAQVRTVIAAPDETEKPRPGGAVSRPAVAPRTAGGQRSEPERHTEVGPAPADPIRPAAEENAARPAAPLMYGPDGVRIRRVGER